MSEKWTNDHGVMVELTDGEVFIIEWQRGTLGGFLASLASAMARADPHNLALLERGFPVEAQAMRAFKNDENFARQIIGKGFDI